MPKLHLPYVEFYITNFCNFNCTGCNRFNNYVFAGHQEWSNYAELYKQWSELLDFDEYTILGGEPMTNPDYIDWLENISKMWPDARGSFLTNGFYLKADNRALYDAIKNTNGRVSLDIGLHNLSRREEVLSVVRNWLRGDIVETRYPKNIRELTNFDQNWSRSYAEIKDSSWPDCPTSDDWDSLPDYVKKECETIHNFSPALLSENRLGYKLVDGNGVKVTINNENYFHQGALKRKEHSFELHDSNPTQAHEICHSKFCHHFDKGLLYKCGQVSVFKEFDKQFYLDISDQDRTLIESYQPASVDNTPEELLQFIENIDKPMPQCKFCPENYNMSEIFAEHGKKIKFHRKKHVQV